MILQALTHLYTELEKQGKVPVESWGKSKVTHRLILDEKGTLLGIVSAKKKSLRGKKEVEEAIEMDVPMPVNRSSGIKANFLCDNSSYFLGIDDKGNPERTKKCFSAAKVFHHKILENCNSLVAQAILQFFDTWNLDNAINQPIVVNNEKEILKAGNFIFQVNGIDATTDSLVREAWHTYSMSITREKNDNSVGTCLITGKENQTIAILHPKIKGVPHAQSSGANLVSFNSTAFCSYGHDDEQGKNAPVSEGAAFAYGTALNALLADKKHRKSIGDTMVVYWSEHALSLCQDFMADLLGDDNGVDDETLDAVIDHIKRGETISLDGIDFDSEEPFYILGLAPNAARISVRFFLKNTFGKVILNLSAHQERMDLIHPSWEKRRIPVWKTLKEIINPHTTNKNKVSSPLLSGSLMRSVLNNTRYPEALYQNMMMRIFSDQDKKGENGSGNVQKINYVRVAFIKAYLLKNGSKQWKEQLGMDINENCNELSYVLGRMFAVLEEIQKNANPDVNSTIKDRYYNSACATPASVFPILWKLANAHLSKLRKGNPGRAVNLQKKLVNLMAKVEMPNTGMPLPSRLTLEEQGAFVIGYYQEMQARYNKKSENNEVNKEEK